MCDQPEIILKNTGEQTLENATIEYWICGGPHDNIHGTEAYLLMSLKMWCYQYLINLFGTMRNFVKIPCSHYSSNGTTDEYEKNNYYSTTFETPPVYPNEISLWTRTNGAGYETRLFVTDVDGNEIFSRISFQNNTL